MDSMTDTDTEDPRASPECSRCRRQLEPREDRMASGNWYKRCNRCRSSAREYERRRSERRRNATNTANPTDPGPVRLVSRLPLVAVSMSRIRQWIQRLLLILPLRLYGKRTGGGLRNSMTFYTRISWRFANVARKDGSGWVLILTVSVPLVAALIKTKVRLCLSFSTEMIMHVSISSVLLAAIVLTMT
jgi:hypothetical protein